nr:hypothetical protein [Tanacetum cinerariifolium]
MIPWELLILLVSLKSKVFHLEDNAHVSQTLTTYLELRIRVSVILPMLAMLAMRRCVTVKRQRVCESDFGSVSLPEGIGNSVGDIIKQACSDRNHYTNNVRPVDLSSLGGCLPDSNVTGDCSSKTTAVMEDINVPTVSSLDNCMPRADVTCMFA